MWNEGKSVSVAGSQQNFLELLSTQLNMTRTSMTTQVITVEENRFPWRSKGSKKQTNDTQLIVNTSPPAGTINPTASI